MSNQDQKDGVFMKNLDFHSLAREIARLESGAEEVNQAQINEVVSLVINAFADHMETGPGGIDEVVDFLKRRGKKSG